MGRHEHEDLSQLRSSLLPATVEELAAQERAEQARSAASRWAGRVRQPLIVALATTALLAAGAGAAVLAQPAGDAVLMRPEQPYSPLNADFEDGFGQWLPEPGRMPMATTPSPASPSPEGPGVLVSPSESASADPASVEEPTLTATYWLDTWSGGYNVYVWLDNSGVQSESWTVRIQLPPGATVARYWEAYAVWEPNNVIRFSSPYGKIPADGTYLFGFYGGKSAGPFEFLGCDINDNPCHSSG